MSFSLFMHISIGVLTGVCQVLDTSVLCWRQRWSPTHCTYVERSRRNSSYFARNCGLRSSAHLGLDGFAKPSFISTHFPGSFCGNPVFT